MGAYPYLAKMSAPITMHLEEKDSSMATKKTMAVAITTTAVLPVWRRPEDEGWYIETGSLADNLWKRVEIIDFEDLSLETLAEIADTITREMKTRVLASELKATQYKRERDAFKKKDR